LEPIAQRFRIPAAPLADPAAVVLAPQARFTLLTSRLIRIEYSPHSRFEDRPSQAFWHRRQPVPRFEVQRTREGLEVRTDHLLLRYAPERGGLTPESLSIQVASTGATWHVGDEPTGNLLGTARTLDQADGPVPLELGLLSRAGWAVVDDSRSLVFNDQGWLEPRGAEPGTLDLYFFGYGHDYLACLRDLRRVAGPAPLIPRWALGNWWSRYWAYSQEELQALMLEFQAHSVPLSVCIVDMDWHITQTGNSCSGWTGYTWNRELFPDAEGFIAWLHANGLRTALNLHPAEGVHPHECAYEEMARAVGIDPACGKPVPFDIADPTYAEAYFRILHHPLEAAGVDFWWIDWQQGTLSRLPDLDPLWWLNHLHFFDLGRDGKKRPFIFSRWGGLGNHRYPIGFSGDSVVSWRSLAFQPYFTATAANVGYGWWSHDIGGHMHGIEEPELYLRWVQFGVFSPILRLHSTKNPYHERRPWGYDDEIGRLARQALQLRHRLIPYLYTMAWRDHREGIPLVCPMYYEHPKREEAYHCPNQYAFGSELVAAPHVRPADPETRLSHTVVWLPEGDWFDFFSGEHLPGNAWHSRYGGLDDIPVYARAGAIVPLGPQVGWGGIANPGALEVHIFPGADNRFLLYEDDGESQAYASGHYALTPLAQAWRGSELEFTIGPVEGDAGQTPERRRYDLVFHGVARPPEVVVRVNGQARPYQASYEAPAEALRIGGLELGREEVLSVTLSVPSGTLLGGRDRTPETLRRMLRAFRLETHTKYAIDMHLAQVLAEPQRLAGYPDLSDAQLRALLEVIVGAGVDVIDSTGTAWAILWNNRGEPRMRYQHAVRWRGRHFGLEEGALPAFCAIPLGGHGDRERLRVDYLGLAAVAYQGRG